MDDEYLGYDFDYDDEIFESEIEEDYSIGPSGYCAIDDLSNADFM